MLKIVLALRRDGSCWSRNGHLMNDAKILLNSFQSWSVGHVKRNANEATHVCKDGYF
jgi:hypothetical protein